MNKIGHEVKFENLLNTAQRELNVLLRNPTKQRVGSIREKGEELEKTIKLIQEVLMGNSRINKRDATVKIEDYKAKIRSVMREVDKIEMTLMQDELTKDRQREQPMTEGEQMDLQNRKMATDMTVQTVRIQRGMEDAREGQRQGMRELEAQGEQLSQIEDEVNQAETNISLIDDLMRTINNRALMTKLILVAMAVFLGVADVLVLLIKIIR